MLDIVYSFIFSYYLGLFIKFKVEFEEEVKIKFEIVGVRSRVEIE